MNVWVEVAGKSAATLLTADDLLEIAQNAELLIRCRNRKGMEPRGELHRQWLQRHCQLLDDSGLDYETLPYDQPAQDKQRLLFRNFPEPYRPHFQSHLASRTTRTRSVAKTQSELLAEFWPDFETRAIKALTLAAKFQERPRLLLPFGQPPEGWRRTDLTDYKAKFDISLRPFDRIHPTRAEVRKWNGELAKQFATEYIRLCSERDAEFEDWLREAVIQIRESVTAHDWEHFAQYREWAAHLEWLERHDGIRPPKPICAEEPDGHRFIPPLPRDCHRVQRDALGTWERRHNKASSDDGLYRDNYTYEGARKTTLPEDMSRKRRLIEDRVRTLAACGMLTEERLIDEAATYASVEGGAVVEQLVEQTGKASSTLRARKRRVTDLATHCKRGHALTPDNVYIRPGAHRYPFVKAVSGDEAPFGQD